MLNWAGVDPALFELLCGNQRAILSGQLWRLFTAPLLHDPTSIGHILFTLIGLYFLGPSLEEAWGPRRMLRFLVLSAVIAYALQLLVAVLLPASLSAKLVPGFWFGALPVVEAIAIAFALSFKGRVVRLFFILPVSSTGLIVFVVAISVLMVIARQMGPSGLIAPFGGMLAGWLLGSSPSPLRRWYLQRKLQRLEQEAARARADRKRRVERSGLRVLEGGGQDGEDDDRGPDSKLLN